MSHSPNIDPAADAPVFISIQAKQRSRYHTTE
jgi:hypothetical protein